LTLFANKRFVESLDNRQIACAVLFPLIFLQIVRSGDFGPEGVQLGFEFRRKCGFVVIESDKTVWIVALIFYAVEVIEVLTGGPETSDDPFVAALAKINTLAGCLSSWVCSSDDGNSTQLASPALPWYNCKCMGGILSLTKTIL
jgi:hypothetical protein